MPSQDTFLRDRSRFSLVIALALLLAAAVAFAGQRQQAHHLAVLRRLEIKIDVDALPTMLKPVCVDKTA